MLTTRERDLLQARQPPPAPVDVPPRHVERRPRRGRRGWAWWLLVVLVLVVGAVALAVMIGDETQTATPPVTIGQDVALTWPGCSLSMTLTRRLLVVW